MKESELYICQQRAKSARTNNHVEKKWGGTHALSFSLQTNFSQVCLRQPFIPEILLRPGVQENVSKRQPLGRQSVANCTLMLVQKTDKQLTLAAAYHAQVKRLAQQVALEHDEQKALEELCMLRR